MRHRVIHTLEHNSARNASAATRCPTRSVPTATCRVPEYRRNFAAVTEQTLLCSPGSELLLGVHKMTVKSIVLSVRPTSCALESKRNDDLTEPDPIGLYVRNKKQYTYKLYSLNKLQATASNSGSRKRKA